MNADICPDCGGKRTVRKGVCFRCGYRQPREATTVRPARPLPPPATSSPRAPHWSSAPPQSPVVPTTPIPASRTGSTVSKKSQVEGHVVGRVTTMGMQRTELVVLKWGDLLTRTFVRLAVVVGAVVFVKAYLPFVIVVGLAVLFFASVRSFLPVFLMPMLSGRGRERQRQEREIEVSIQPFTITVSDGKEKEVILRGELRGGSPHLGDCVEVSGKEMRDGTIRARSVYNTSTGARITMREHPAIVRSRVKVVGSLLGIAILGYVLVVSLQFLSQLV